MHLAPGKNAPLNCLVINFPRGCFGLNTSCSLAHLSKSQRGSVVQTGIFIFDMLVVALSKILMLAIMSMILNQRVKKWVLLNDMSVLNDKPSRAKKMEPMV